MVFFFFFQAEDGIRDLYVTGVQTCALPISSCCSCRTAATSTGRAGSGEWTRLQGRRCGRSEERRVGKGVDLGGRRLIKKKKKKRNKTKKNKQQKKKKKEKTNNNT